MEEKVTNIKKSMFLNILAKPIGMVITLLYTPFLLAYLGNEKYGIWVTVLSVINWINFFDIGIGNGYRNILAENLVKKDFY